MKNQIFTPEAFKEAFITATASSQQDILYLWDSKVPYTELMISTVLKEIAKQLEISVYAGNYYYLDSVFYCERDIEHFSPDAYYAKSISIAIEHENDIKGTAVEMNKLQLFNAPLKVLITYTQTELERKTYLDRYAKIIKWADIFNDFSTHRKQIVIFGSRDEDYKAVVWHCYVYDKSGFEVL